MINKIYLRFLEDYFSLFEAVIVIYSLTDDTISGKVGWKGETDEQEFKWTITISDKDALNLSEVCTLIKKNNFNDNDKIIIPEDELLEELVKYKWKKEDAVKLIDLLLDIEVKMIDEGEETDSFFIHL